MTSKAMWESANLKGDVAGYAAALDGLGVEITPAQLTARLQATAKTFGALRTAIAAPFGRYSALFGVRQGWAMFGSPQRYPAEVHVEVLENDRWRPIYRPHDPAHAWLAETMTHNRMRKFAGRFARGFVQKNYDELSRWLARQASVDFPQASRIRVHLYRYRSLHPLRVQAGERPQGHYERIRTYDAAELRP